MSTILKLIENLDQLIKAGRMRDAKDLLSRFSRSQVPREHASTVSHLARRCGYPHYGLKLLMPFVRPDSTVNITKQNQKISPATPFEIAAYASNLTNIGATQESYALLKSIPENASPDILLYKIFALFGQWKYGSSIPLAKRYINRTPKTEYMHWVGVTNLAAALIACNHLEEANTFLKELVFVAKEKNYKLLLANAHTLEAQVYVEQKNFAKAKLALQQAKDTLVQQSLYHSLIKKWTIIVNLLQNCNADSIARAKDYRQESINNNYWENVRDIDYYLGKVTQDTQLLTRVYYGTPFMSYRRRILKEVGPNLKLPKKMTLFGSHFHKIRSLDEILTNETQFSKILQILLFDHYQPLRLGRFFSLLYAEEFYNPFSSPHRVDQAIYRFRVSSTAKNLGLDVVRANDSYKLISVSEEALEVSLSLLRSFQSSVTQTNKAPHWLRDPKLTKKSFTSQHLSKHLGISQRTAQRLIKDAINNDMLMSLSNGRSTRYQAKGRNK